MEDLLQLTELVDDLGHYSDEEDMNPKDILSTVLLNQPNGPAGAEGGPSGEHTASAFWRCAQEQGFTAFADALTLCGLRDEMPQLSGPGLTIIAPTNEAFAQMTEAARSDQRVVRQLLLGHMCSGSSSLSDLKTKNCAVAVAGQTHAVYEEGEHIYVGTGRFGRTDIFFDGGYMHEVTSVLMVLSLIRDSHSEQVWKKTLQPSPILSAIGGVSSTGETPTPMPCCALLPDTRLPPAAPPHVQPCPAAPPRREKTANSPVSLPPSPASRPPTHSGDTARSHHVQVDGRRTQRWHERESSRLSPSTQHLGPSSLDTRRPPPRPSLGVRGPRMPAARCDWPVGAGGPTRSCACDQASR